MTLGTLAPTVASSKVVKRHLRIAKMMQHSLRGKQRLVRHGKTRWIVIETHDGSGVKRPEIISVRLPETIGVHASGVELPLEETSMKRQIHSVRHSFVDRALPKFNAEEKRGRTRFLKCRAFGLAVLAIGVVLHS